MKRILTAVVLILFTSFAYTTKAQMVEQVLLHDGSGNALHTILTGINNNGYITGYAVSGTDTTGVIITPKGKIIYVQPIDLFVDHTSVQSINDKNTALIVGRTGGATTIYRCYMTAAKDSIDHIVECTNVLQPSATPTDINNSNDISGAYKGATDYMFIKHDSIAVGGNPPWVSKKYDVGGSFNTYCGGINDANKVVGYYIDGTTLSSFVYDNIAHSFNELSSIYKVKPWDINNNNVVVGEYKSTTGTTYNAFYANAINGGYNGFTSLNSIFQSTTIQSVANGVNDNKDIVGCFLHPTLNVWCGFIYHPNIQEYRLPGYSFTQHSWSILNDNTGTNHAWPATYTQGINYAANDPYANNNQPLVDNYIHVAYPQVTTLENDRDPTWKSFATEFDKTHAGISPLPAKQNYYRTILRPKIFDKWYPFTTVGFSGHCYGFAFSSLLRCYYDNLFSSWYGIPANTNLSQVQNTDNTSLFAIERGQTKQLDRSELKYQQKPEWLWQGLYRLKTSYLQPFATADPFMIKIKPSATDDSYHELLPYKIRTPRILPFTANDCDTIFVYDSNVPSDSTKFIMFQTRYVFEHPTIKWSNVYGSFPVLTFRQQGIRAYQNKQFSTFKSTSSTTYDPDMTIGLIDAGDYSIRWNGNPIATKNSGTFSYDSLSITPIFRIDANIIPSQHFIDTGKLVNIVTSNYTANAMVLTQLNSSRSMGLSRTAQGSETDYSSQKNAMIAYGNPDNTTKYLNGFMRESEDQEDQGVNIIVSNICADQGDSIVTSSPAPYVYNITKLNGTNSCTYHLTVFAAYNGEITEFNGDADIQPNSSHTIDPYYVGSNGTQVAVIVDNGNDGIADDTLFVQGWPVDIKTPIKDEHIKVYPNPVSDKLSIELAGNYDSYDIRLTDVAGKAVYTTTSKNGKLDVPTNTLASGMYLLQISDNKGHILYLDKVTKQ